MGAIAAVAWGVDGWFGPLSNRITDQAQSEKGTRIVAVAGLFPDSYNLMDFLDTLKVAYEEEETLQVDIVRGRLGADLATMDATPPDEWAKRVLISYRRDGDTEQTVLSRTVPGPIAR